MGPIKLSNILRSPLVRAAIDAESSAAREAFRSKMDKCPIPDYDQAVAGVIRRISGAARKFEGIASAVRDWEAKAPVRFEALVADDRLSYRVFARINPPPSLNEWGDEFGIAVTLLRSGLDILTNRIAAVSGLSESQLANVQFPIVTRANEWDSQSRGRLRGVPESVRSVVRSIQPFENEAAGLWSAEADPLWLIGWLSNRPRHRVELNGELGPNDVDFGLELLFEGGGRTSTEFPNVTVDATLRDGSVFLHHITAPDRIVSGTGTMNLSYTVCTRGPAQEQVGLTSWGDQAIVYVSEIARKMMAVWVPEGYLLPPNLHTAGQESAAD